MHDHDGTVAKKAKNVSPVDDFMDWAKGTAGIQLNEKVTHSKDVAAHWGMIATDDIKCGEMVFMIPATSVLSPETCGISDLLTKNLEDLGSASGWIPLILALMYERNNPNSKWKPYLDAFPNFDGMELPMFWSKEDLENEFTGTGIVESVSKDLKNMREEHSNIVLPFLKKHKSIFNEDKYETFEYFQQQAAFIMSYSFTDDVNKPEESDPGSDSDSEPPQKPFPTIMVPMADLLNHVPNHNAELKMGENTLRMMAVKDINKGDEVFNTFGQISNHTLMMMYGFTVPADDNPYNSIQISLSELKQTSQQLADKQTGQLDWKTMELCNQLFEQRDIQTDEAIFLHKQGIDDELHLLQVLCMSTDELKSSIEQNRADSDDGWESDDDSDSLTFENLPSRGPNLKLLLKKTAENLLNRLPIEHEHSTPTKKQTFSRYLRESRRQLLNNLIKVVN